jgi:hypothetical protein
MHNLVDEGGLSMRKVVATEMVSLDGGMEKPEEWVPPYYNDEMAETNASGMAASDVMLFGRVTYEEFAAFWPYQDRTEQPYTDYLNNTPPSTSPPSTVADRGRVGPVPRRGPLGDLRDNPCGPARRGAALAGVAGGHLRDLVRDRPDHASLAETGLQNREGSRVA